MTLKEKVLIILRVSPDTRNSDITLTNKLWRQYYLDQLAFVNGKYSIPLENMYNVPTQDAVKRIRAEIQNNEHLYPPTSLEVAKQRKMLEQTWFEASFNKFNNI